MYVLSHPHYGDKVKIGFTERTVEERIAELEAGAGAPRGLELSYAIATSNPRELEYKIHRKLADRRTWKDKEFFETSPQEAAVVLKFIAKNEGFKIFDELDPAQLVRAEREKEEAKKRIVSEMIERQKPLEPAETRRLGEYVKRHVERERQEEQAWRRQLAERLAEDVKIQEMEREVDREDVKYKNSTATQLTLGVVIVFCCGLFVFLFV